MASLLLSFAGQAIAGSLVTSGFLAASYFGVATAQIGGAIGTFLGSTFFSDGPNVEVSGARLNDLSGATADIEGVLIPFCYGTTRVSGKIIWSADITEVTETTTQDAGGKGGGGATQTTTTYAYFLDFAIGICEGPIAGIKRIFINKNLVYENTETDLSKQDGHNFVFYNGSEDQIPNATIEEYMGEGNVPAYRGLSYIVFNQLPLESYGNAVPLSIEFEIYATADESCTTLYSQSLAEATADLENITHTIIPGGYTSEPGHLYGAGYNWGIGNIYLYTDFVYFEYEKNKEGYIRRQLDLKGSPQFTDNNTTISRTANTFIPMGNYIVAVHSVEGVEGNYDGSYVFYERESGVVANISSVRFLRNEFQTYGKTYKVLDYNRDRAFKIEKGPDRINFNLLANGQLELGGFIDTDSIYTATINGTDHNLLSFLYTNPGIEYFSGIFGNLSCDNWRASDAPGLLNLNIAYHNPLAYNTYNGVDRNFVNAIRIYLEDGIVVTDTPDYYWWWGTGEFQGEDDNNYNIDILVKLVPTYPTDTIDAWTDIRPAILNRTNNSSAFTTNYANSTGTISDVSLSFSNFVTIDKDYSYFAVTFRFPGDLVNTFFGVYKHNDGVVWVKENNEAPGLTADEYKIQYYDNIITYYAGSGNLYVLELSSGNILKYIDKGCISDTYRYYDPELGTVTTYDGSTFKIVNTQTPSNGYSSLGAIAEDICNRSGIPSSYVSVTDVNDIVVHGFNSSTLSSGNSLLSNLLPCYGVNSFESQQKIQFKKEKLTKDITILIDDLVLIDDKDKVSIETVDIKDLPKRLDLQYKSLDKNNQITHVSSKELIAKEESNKESLQVPITFTDLLANDVANNLLRRKWEYIKKVTIHLPKKYAYLEPGDVILIYREEEALHFRITNITTESESYTKIEGVSILPKDFIYEPEYVSFNDNADKVFLSDISYVFTHAFVLPFASQLDTYNKPTTKILHNIVNYANWKGAVIYSSNDGEIYKANTSVKYPLVRGIVLNVPYIGMHESIYTRDIIQNISIKFKVEYNSNYLLTSLSDSEFFNNTSSNTMILYNNDKYEILRFKEATTSDNNNYTISKLYRGLYGTVPFSNTSGLLAYVLPNNNIEDYVATIDELNTAVDTEKYYKFVNIGSNISDANINNYTYTDDFYWQNPVSDIYHEVNSGNIDIFWQISSIHNTGVFKEPLAEPTHYYKIEIYDFDTDTLLRTITDYTRYFNTTQYYRYTAADLATDSMTTSSNLYVKIYKRDNNGLYLTYGDSYLNVNYLDIVSLHSVSGLIPLDDINDTVVVSTGSNGTYSPSNSLMKNDMPGIPFKGFNVGDTSVNGTVTGLNTSSVGTTSFWLRFEDLAEGEQRILVKHNTGDGYISLYKSSGDTRIRFGRRTNSINLLPGKLYFVNVIASAVQYYHLYYYIDIIGDRTGTGIITQARSQVYNQGWATFGGSTLYIGTNVLGTPTGNRIYISNVAHWNTTELTSTQTKDIYNKGAKLWHLSPLD